MKFEAKPGGDPRFYQMLEEIGELHGRKNTDYAKGGLHGHLGNFKRSEVIKRLYPGFDWTSDFGTAMDYLIKQLDAAFMLYSQQRESITGEGIPQRMRDVAVYSLIGSLLWMDSVSGANLVNSIRPGTGQGVYPDGEKLAEAPTPPFTQETITDILDDNIRETLIWAKRVGKDHITVPLPVAWLEMCFKLKDSEPNAPTGYSRGQR